MHCRSKKRTTPAGHLEQYNIHLTTSQTTVSFGTASPTLFSFGIGRPCRLPTIDGLCFYVAKSRRSDSRHFSRRASPLVHGDDHEWDQYESNRATTPRMRDDELLEHAHNPTILVLYAMFSASRSSGSLCPSCDFAVARHYGRRTAGQDGGPTTARLSVDGTRDGDGDQCRSSTTGTSYALQL